VSAERGITPQELPPAWRPARECPQDGRPVDVAFPGEIRSEGDVEPCVMRRLGPTLWVGVLGALGPPGMSNPDRWRELSWDQWAELAQLFPGAVPTELPGLAMPQALTSRRQSSS
jgi:hypothetical protein